MNARTSHALALLYPRAWRREYGEEFTDLLTATPVSSRVVADVVGHAALLRAEAAGRTLGLLAGTVVIRPVAMGARMVGYVLSDDLHAVYGDDPNHTRDPNNVGGNIAANIAGGVGNR